MSSAEAHLQRHEELSQACVAFEALEESDPIRPWGLVVRFYSALHLVEAYIVAKGLPNSGDHGARGRQFSKLKELERARRAYDLLQQVSEAVRYIPEATIGATEWTETSTALAKLTSIVRPKLDTKLAQTK